MSELPRELWANIYGYIPEETSKLATLSQTTLPLTQIKKYCEEPISQREMYTYFIDNAPSHFAIIEWPYHVNQVASQQYPTSSTLIFNKIHTDTSQTSLRVIAPDLVESLKLPREIYYNSSYDLHRYVLGQTEDTYNFYMDDDIFSYIALKTNENPDFLRQQYMDEVNINLLETVTYKSNDADFDIYTQYKLLKNRGSCLRSNPNYAKNNTINKFSDEMNILIKDAENYLDNAYMKLRPVYYLLGNAYVIGGNIWILYQQFFERLIDDDVDNTKPLIEMPVDITDEELFDSIIGMRDTIVDYIMGL